MDSAATKTGGRGRRKIDGRSPPNITDFNGVRTASYDAENRIYTATESGITQQANVTETYAYDGEGRRVAKTGTDGTWTYLYDANGATTALSGISVVATRLRLWDWTGKSLTGTSTYSTNDSCARWLRYLATWRIALRLPDLSLMFCLSCFGPSNA